MQLATLEAAIAFLQQQGQQLGRRSALASLNSDDLDDAKHGQHLPPRLSLWRRGVGTGGEKLPHCSSDEQTLTADKHFICRTLAVIKMSQAQVFQIVWQHSCEGGGAVQCRGSS